MLVIFICFRTKAYAGGKTVQKIKDTAQSRIRKTADLIDYFCAQFVVWIG